MKQLLLLLILTGFPFVSKAQNYIYYFEGELDNEKISLLEGELSKIIGISSAKVKSKENTNFGEVQLSLKVRKEQSEIDTQFTPVDIKKILIDHQLTPIQFIESK